MGLVCIFNEQHSGLRSPGDRPYSVIKWVIHGRHTFVSTIRRAKAMFLYLGHNALTMITLKNKGKSRKL